MIVQMLFSNSVKFEFQSFVSHVLLAAFPRWPVPRQPWGGAPRALPFTAGSRPAIGCRVTWPHKPKAPNFPNCLSFRQSRKQRRERCSAPSLQPARKQRQTTNGFVFFNFEDFTFRQLGFDSEKGRWTLGRWVWLFLPAMSLELCGVLVGTSPLVLVVWEPGLCNGKKWGENLVGVRWSSGRIAIRVSLRTGVNKSGRHVKLVRIFCDIPVKVNFDVYAILTFSFRCKNSILLVFWK